MDDAAATKAGTNAAFTTLAAWLLAQSARDDEDPRAAVVALISKLEETFGPRIREGLIENQVSEHHAELAAHAFSTTLLDAGQLADTILSRY